MIADGGEKVILVQTIGHFWGKPMVPCIKKSLCHSEITFLHCLLSDFIKYLYSRGVGRI